MEIPRPPVNIDPYAWHTSRAVMDIKFLGDDISDTYWVDVLPSCPEIDLPPPPMCTKCRTTAKPEITYETDVTDVKNRSGKSLCKGRKIKNRLTSLLK